MRRDTARNAGNMSKQKYLRAGNIYVGKTDFRVGVLQRCKCPFTGRRLWEIDFGSSVLPQYFNPHFTSILARGYTLIGDL